MRIIPTGDLEGCQDSYEKTRVYRVIIPTGDLEGCQDYDEVDGAER